jgi:GrpB-like predicted nucleotidyltransferase (UPF0157 family)
VFFETYNCISSCLFSFIQRSDNPPPHMMFVKGYTEEGMKGQSFHIHIRYIGDWDEIYFRNYLIEHPHFAKEYEQLKIDLSARYKYDREAYTNSKTDFVKRIVKLARESSSL